MNIYDFLTKRTEKLTITLRSQGLELPSTAWLRSVVRSSGGQELYLDADPTPGMTPQVDKAKMSATFVITTPRKDRYGDVVIPRGCVKHLGNYQKNPRVFFSHKSMDFPIGSARKEPGAPVDVQVFDDHILSTCWFNGLTPESEICFAMVCRGELEASSIGFLPVVAAIIKDPDNPDQDDTNQFGEDLIHFGDQKMKFFPSLRFHEWDLTEWSIVPTPANPDAIATHLSRGHVEGIKLTPVLRKSLEPYAAPRKVWSPGALMETLSETPVPVSEPETKDFGSDLVPPPAQEAPKPAEEEDPCKGMLMGAKLLHHSIQKAMDWHDCIKGLADQVEQSRVKKYASKKLLKLQNETYKLKKFAKELYPEHFDDPGQPPEQKSLEEIPSAEPPVPVQEPPVVVKETNWQLIMDQLEQLQSTNNKLSDAFYALTGKEI